MPISLVQRATPVSIVGAASGSISLAGVTAGNLIVLKYIAWGSGGAPPTLSFSDSQSQTIGFIEEDVNAGFTIRNGITFIANTLSGSHTVTATLGASGNAIIYMEEWAGLDVTSPKDAAGGSTGSSTAFASGNLITGNANEVIIGIATVPSGVTPTLDATITANAVVTNGAQSGIDGYRIVSSTGTYQFLGTISSSATWIASAITFTAVSTAGTPTKLGITKQPSGTNRSGSAFQVQPKVAIQDSSGVTVASSTATVVATITTGTGTFVGTVSVNAVAGIATFTNLGITGTGIFIVTFTSTGLVSAAANWMCVVRTNTTLDGVTKPTQLFRPSFASTIVVNPSDTTDFQNKLNANTAGNVRFQISGSYGKIIIPAFTAWAVIEDVNAPAYIGRTEGSSKRIDALTAATFATISTPDSGPAVSTSLTPSKNCWFRQVHITCASGLTIQYGLVTFGTDGPGGQTNSTLVAHDFGIEQCWIQSPNDSTTSRIGVACNCGAVSIIDSLIGPQHEVGIESQAIATWNGMGPYYIDNNELSAAGEVFIAGGSDSADTSIQPSNLYFTRNHCFAQAAWKTNGLGWSVKNIFELKNMKKAFVAYNVFENMWRANQDGHGIAVKSVNQGGTAPWSGSSDIEFCYNTCRNMGGFVDFGANPDNNNQCLKLQRVYFHDNWAYNINPVQSGTYNSDSPLMFLQQGGIADLRFEHNTGFSNDFPPMDLGDGGTAPKAIALGPGFDSGGGVFVAIDPTLDGTFKHNLLDPGLYSCVGDGTTGQTAWNTYMAGVVQQTNLFVRSGASIMDPGRMISSGTYIDTLTTNPDGSISAGSPYKNWAADGKDPGADFTILTPTLTSNVISGNFAGSGGGGGGGSVSTFKAARRGLIHLR